MKKTKDYEVLQLQNYRPTKLKKAVLVSTLTVNIIVTITFFFFVWSIASIGGNNVENYCNYHAGQHNINCLLSENY